MGFPLYVTCCFSLAAFYSLFCLVFVILISMCLGMFLLVFILFGTLCASWTWYFLFHLGKISTIISSKIFSYPLFYSSSSGTLIIRMLVCFALGLSCIGFFVPLGFDYFLFHVGEIFNYNGFKKFFITFLFLFLFWDTYNSNVGTFDTVPGVSKTILNSLQSFYFILLFRSYFHHFIFQLTDSFFCLIYSIDSF